MATAHVKSRTTELKFSLPRRVANVHSRLGGNGGSWAYVSTIVLPRDGLWRDVFHMSFVLSRAGLPFVVRGDSPTQGPLKLLAEADRLALLYNWPGAAPRYAEAESLFAQSGDGKNALAARLGYIWSTADTGVSPATNREVAAYLENPLVQSDSTLMLRALVAKAVLDGHMARLYLPLDPDTAEWTKEFEPADVMDANEDDALDVVACAGCPGESCETCAGLGFYHDANQCP